MINKGQIHNLFQTWFKTKSEDDYKNFYDYTYDLVENLSFVYCQNKQRASEFADEVFVIIYNTSRDELPSFDEVNWIYELIKDKYIEEYKNALKAASEEQITLQYLYWITDENEYTKQRVETVEYNDMIAAARPHIQEIIALKYLGLYSIEDIAIILNEKTNKVRTKYYLAQKILRISLESFIFFIITLILYCLNIKQGTTLTKTYLPATIAFGIISLITFLYSSIYLSFISSYIQFTSSKLGNSSLLVL